MKHHGVAVRPRAVRRRRWHHLLRRRQRARGRRGQSGQRSSAGPFPGSTCEYNGNNSRLRHRRSTSDVLEASFFLGLSWQTRARLCTAHFVRRRRGVPSPLEAKAAALRRKRHPSRPRGSEASSGRSLCSAIDATSIITGTTPPRGTATFPTDTPPFPRRRRPRSWSSPTGHAFDLLIAHFRSGVGDDTVRMSEKSIPPQRQRCASAKGWRVRRRTSSTTATSRPPSSWHGLRLENRYDGARRSAIHSQRLVFIPDLVSPTRARTGTTRTCTRTTARSWGGTGIHGLLDVFQCEGTDCLERDSSRPWNDRAPSVTRRCRPLGTPPRVSVAMFTPFAWGSVPSGITSPMFMPIRKQMPRPW